MLIETNMNQGKKVFLKKLVLEQKKETSVIENVLYAS